MLTAEKQLLDANLRNELQLLRKLELKMLVDRYSNAIPAATLIAGFTFTGLVEMNLLTNDDLNTGGPWVRPASNVFHLFAAVALATSIYAMAVCSVAMVLGQRLTVQATAQLTSKHEANVRELSRKFVFVLLALAFALIGVIGAGICTIWVRADGGISIASTVLVALLLPTATYSIVTMNNRLNDSVPEPGAINLRTDAQTMKVSEFRIGDQASIPASGRRDVDAAVRQQAGQGPTEASSLLKCMPPCAA